MHWLKENIQPPSLWFACLFTFFLCVNIWQLPQQILIQLVNLSSNLNWKNSFFFNPVNVRFCWCHIKKNQRAERKTTLSPQKKNPNKMLTAAFTSAVMVRAVTVRMPSPYWDNSKDSLNMYLPLPLWMVRICWATTDSTSRSIRLNSSKHDQAPQDARPWTQTSHIKTLRSILYLMREKKKNHLVTYMGKSFEKIVTEFIRRRSLSIHYSYSTVESLAKELLHENSPPPPTPLNPIVMTT